jgi:hypothetical protein
VLQARHHTLHQGLLLLLHQVQELLFLLQELLQHLVEGLLQSLSMKQVTQHTRGQGHGPI